MGFRFRKAISLGGGARLNLGKRNASMRFGGRGFGITGGTSGLRVSAGLPGTGLSFSRKIGAGRRSSGSRLGSLIMVFFVLGLIGRACGIDSQRSATSSPKSETSLRKDNTSQAGESRKYTDDPGGVAVRFNQQALDILDCEDGLESCLKWPRNCVLHRGAAHANLIGRSAVSPLSTGMRRAYGI